ncbi:MAG: RloB family protein [Prevotellaceae bacterium]|jgi:hypothetical protein|nr:RloB family protein [Prevotellaceae bacterium]
MMINKNRLYQKAEPTREAKVFYIFCEGKRREVEYFKYFVALDSRIKLEIIAPGEVENNSPEGLYAKACMFMMRTVENPFPKYDFADVDEAWFVVDTDDWKDKIDNLRSNCQKHQRWFVAQSNPCFEVWLYYHVYDSAPSSSGMDVAANWKLLVDKSIHGGFDSRLHPVFIEQAICNAKKNYCKKDGKIAVASTEVYQLAEKFFPFIQKIIRRLLAKY